MSSPVNVNAASGAGPLRRAMETIRALRAELEATRGSRRVAVVGLGLRAPGGIEDRASYWRVLEEGRDVTGPLPEGRRAGFGDAWDGLPTHGGYLDEVSGFDARFFGIGPREARNLDPQHRLLLEVVWEAFEDAGLVPGEAAATTGAFVGITGQDHRQWAEPEPSSSWLIGNGHCFAAGRIAYTLGFQGPTMAIDTACSSSLVAVHTACRSLAAGDCDVAVAAGVSLILAPRSTAEIARTQALSPDGACRPFDARANGFVRGEGCGAVVLKRLADAERDGDRVLAVIEGTGVNQDGRSSGFTAPNVLAQTRLIASVLAAAGLEAADIGCLEAHGTGTPLGDPIELEAARDALGGAGRTWYAASSKGNLGHCEAAAGILGLIKAVLCLERRSIPRQAGFRTLNPRIRPEGSGMTVPDRTVAWDPASGRCAAVSSFGMSGTNAHVVLSPGAGSAAATGAARGFLVSAHTEPALRALAARYADLLAEGEADYAAFAWTATHGRTRLAHTVRVDADGAPDAEEALRAFAAGKDDARVREWDASLPVPEAGGTRAVASLPAYPWERVEYALRP